MKRISVFLVFLLLAGCATSGDYDLLQREVNDLKRDSFEEKKELDSLKEKTANVLTDISTLKEKTATAVKEDSFAAVRESQADINSRLTQISSDLQALRGRFEENKYYVDKSLKDSGADRDILRAQITGIEAQVKALKDKLMPSGENEKTLAPSEKEAPKGEGEKPNWEETKPEGGKQAEQAGEEKTVGEKSVYEAAYQLFRDKKYKTAREKFQAFLKEYPDSKLVDNAQFWIAETYYSEKDYEAAILAYETLLKKYPKSEKAAPALLKQAYSFIDIGDDKTGKLLLTKVIEKYPHSKEASQAKKKVSEIGKKPARKR